MKKAQGLPITTIIIAILGLVVIIVLFAILTGKMTIFAGLANECPGICVLPKGGEFGGVEGGNIRHRSPLECTPNIEREQFGKFIASGIRKDNNPIPCERCCQQLA